MQKRLIDIIGRAAYSVSILRLHAFGTEVNEPLPRIFYSGADAARCRRTRQASHCHRDSRFARLRQPLRSRMNGSYTAIHDIIAAISDLKRAGLTDAEFGQLLDATADTIDQVGSRLPKHSPHASARPH